MRSLIYVVCVLFLLSACATANKIAGVQLGMTKDEVVAVMGKPASVSAIGNTAYLNYALSETDDQAWMGLTRIYYVRLINGKVDSYGRAGDFDSTKTQTVRIESDQKVEQNVEITGSSNDLYTELKRLKELKDSGIITDAEFESQKKKLLQKH